MPIRSAAGLLGLLLLSTACTQEYDCEPVHFNPTFIGYSPAELQTFVVRRYRAQDNFRTLLDTAVVRYGYDGSFHTSFDTTFVTLKYQTQIQEGYDWQVHLPAVGRTVRLTDIVTEKKTGKETHGIFSLDKAAPCFNELISAKVDGQPVPLKAGFFGTSGGLYIRK